MTDDSGIEDSGDEGTGSEGGGRDRGSSSGAGGWAPPGSQADLDRIIEQRLARERAKFADYDLIKEKADRHDALENELASDLEKATQRAADQAWTQAVTQAVPRLVRAEFRAEAKGVLDPGQLEALLEDLDLTRYADDDGEPDTAKIAAKIAKFAPPKEDAKRKFPDLGGGNRGGSAKTTDMNALIRSAAGLNGG